MLRIDALARSSFITILAFAVLGALAAPATADTTSREAVLTANASTISGATLAATLPNTTSPNGVSPEVYFEETTRTYYMYAPSVPNMKMYSSSDGSSWAQVTGAVLPQGFDPTVIKLGTNNYRMYYGGIAMGAAATVQCSQQRKSLYYATSTDLVTWTQAPGAIFADIGCGVPDILRKPDGTYVMYYVTMDPRHGVHMATSPDGLTWTALSGLHPDTEDIVDPSVIVMPDNTYLMVASDMGGGSAQQLHIASSPDGVVWTLRASSLYSPSGISAFDPNLNLINGQLRVWYGYSPKGSYDSSLITNGILTLAAGSSTTANSTTGKPGSKCTKAGAKTTYQGKDVVCKKKQGKLVWLNSKRWG